MDWSVTDIEFSGNLTGAQVLAACPWEQMISSTRAMFVSESAGFGRRLPALCSVAELVWSTRLPFFHCTELPVVLWIRSHYHLHSVALFTQCLNPHFIGWQHFTHVNTTLKVILRQIIEIKHKIIQHVIVHKITLLMTPLSVSRYSSFWNNGGVSEHKFYCKNFLNVRKLLGGIPAMTIILSQCSTIKCCWYLHVSTWWVNKCIKFRIEIPCHCWENCQQS